MLQKLVLLSLRFRGVVIALACLWVVYGVHVASRSKLDVFPDFVPPQVTVQTEAPGLSAEQVETLVTRPVETAINGLGDQDSLRSESAQGLSVLTVVFKEGTDVFRARQMLAEKLGEVAGQLPMGVQPPKVSPLTSSTMDLLKIALVSDKLSPMALRTFADWTLKPRLLAVPGVAKCSTYGGEVRQLQIQIDPQRLQAVGIGINDVVTAARNATGVRGAGFVETTNQRVIIQTEGQSTTAEELANTLVVSSASGAPVRLRDVARVVEGAVPKFGDALIQGRPGVLLTMSSQYGANTLEVTRALEAALDEFKPALAAEGITLYPRLHRPATFVEASLRNIQHSLWIGAALVAIVLLLFLGHFRTALISLTAIPLSLLTAVIILEKLGVTLNTITLGGLAIAIGEVVDDAIIDVENIVRRLRENAQRASPRPAWRVVLDASIEVRSAVVYATIVVGLVFVPVLTLTGLQGSFFGPLAQSYLLAIFASLLVALTVTPALSLVVFSRKIGGSQETFLQRKLKSGYSWMLAGIAHHPVAMLLAVAGVCVFAFLRLPSFSGEFLPEFREGHFVLQANLAPGTSLPEMRRLGGKIAAALLANPHIDTVSQQIGRAELGEDPWGPNRSEFHVELKPISADDEEHIADDLRKILGQFPGIQTEVMTFLGDRIGESISGETAPVVVTLFGDDLDTLDAKAGEVAAQLRSVPGAADVFVKSSTGSPTLQIRLRPERLAALGFHPGDVLDTIQTATQGTVVAQTYRREQVADVAVILDEKSRAEPDALRQLLLTNAQGLRVRLSELADFEFVSGRASISHEGARRRQLVTCGVSGRDVASFVKDAEAAIKSHVALPRGTYAVFSGAAQASSEARQELLLNGAMAAIGIILVLSVVLGNLRHVLIVLLNVPFALVGGVVVLWITSAFGDAKEAGLTLGSLVGFVTLFGITMRNSIMLISHYEHLVQEEGQTWGPALAVRGAAERLIPILMTALVTALGLLPLALGAGEAGREIEGPMALVILGGLATSTALNLLVLPTVALRWGRFVRSQDIPDDTGIQRP